MTIGIVSYFNPAECKEYIQKKGDIRQINKAASSVNALVLGFLKAGHKVIVITSYEEEGPTIHLTGERLEVHIVSSFSHRPKADTFRRWYMVKRLRKELKKHVSEMDVIHAHWAYDFALAASTFADRKPVFCTIRDWSPIINSYEKGPKAKFMWWLVSGSIFRRVMRNRKIHFIANSKYIYELVKNSYPANQCDVIENPIKSELICRHRELYPTHPVFVSIAQSINDLRKNYDSLLRAFQDIHQQRPDAKLILIGSYNPNIPLAQEWEKNGLTENVEMMGFVNHDDIIGILDNASVLVHPSLEESFGNTLLEGMARRLPVIGGKESGAIPYVLGHGQYGILCNVKLPLELSAAMQKALNISQMTPILDSATDNLQKNYTNDVIVQKHIQLFSKIIKKDYE